MSRAQDLATLLDVNGDIKVDALDNVDALPDQTGSSGKYLTTDGTTASWDTVESLPDAIDVDASAPADSLAIDSAGKIGAGTLSPAQKAHISDTSIAGSVRLRLENSEGAADIGTDASGMKVWVDSSGGAGTEVLTVTSTGRLGVNTPSPERELHVTGGAVITNPAGQSLLRLESLNGAACILEFADAADGNVGRVNYDHLANLMSFVTADATKLYISSSGTVYPNTNNAQDLGTSSIRWRNIYTNDLNLSNGIGDYTIVEGEEDLFLYNNKSGKVFKFALIEVDPSEAPPKTEKS